MEAFGSLCGTMPSVHKWSHPRIQVFKTVSGGDPRQEANHWLLEASTSRITGLAEVALNHSDVLWVHLFMQCHSALLYCILDTLPKFQEHEKKSMKDMVSAPGGLMCHWLWYQAKSWSQEKEWEEKLHKQKTHYEARRIYISLLHPELPQTTNYLLCQSVKLLRLAWKGTCD